MGEALSQTFDERGIKISDKEAFQKWGGTEEKRDDLSARQAATLRDSFQWPDDLVHRYAAVLDEDEEKNREAVQSWVERIIVNEQAQGYLVKAEEVALQSMNRLSSKGKGIAIQQVAAVRTVIRILKKFAEELESVWDKKYLESLAVDPAVQKMVKRVDQAMGISILPTTLSDWLEAIMMIAKWSGEKSKESAFLTRIIQKAIGQNENFLTTLKKYERDESVKKLQRVCNVAEVQEAFGKGWISEDEALTLLKKSTDFISLQAIICRSKKKYGWVLLTQPLVDAGDVDAEAVEMQIQNNLLRSNILKIQLNPGLVLKAIEHEMLGEEVMQKGLQAVVEESVRAWEERFANTSSASLVDLIREVLYDDNEDPVEDEIAKTRFDFYRALALVKGWNPAKVARRGNDLLYYKKCGIQKPVWDEVMQAIAASDSSEFKKMAAKLNPDVDVDMDSLGTLRKSDRLIIFQQVLYGHLEKYAALKEHYEKIEERAKLLPNILGTIKVMEKLAEEWFLIGKVWSRIGDDYPDVHVYWIQEKMLQLLRDRLMDPGHSQDIVSVWDAIQESLEKIIRNGPREKSYRFTLCMMVILLEAAVLLKKKVGRPVNLKRLLIGLNRTMLFGDVKEVHRRLTHMGPYGLGLSKGSELWATFYREHVMNRLRRAHLL